jgi:hypothetical protein
MACDVGLGQPAKALGQKPAQHCSYVFYPFFDFFSNYKFQGIPLRFQKTENRIKLRKIQTKFYWDHFE